MKISIMITSYNLVDYIDESIQSVVQQEMPCDWELLIGDDGSNDGTIEKLKLWQEKYPDNIRYWVNDRPQTKVKDGYRAGKNRASLLERASGDYLIYLDGDDCWLGTEKLKTQFAILEDPSNSDCSCCAHNIQAYVIPENRKYSWINENVPSQKLSASQYWSHYYFHTNTILFRKECKQILLTPLYRIHLNDNFITYLLLQKGKVCYLDRVWARYNMSGDGLWTGNKRIYGMFRNITLFDLELIVNKSLKNKSIMKHWRDIQYVISNYKDKDKDLIEPIISALDKNIFKYTYLLSILPSKRGFGEKLKIFKLKLSILITRILNKLNII